MTGRKLTWSLRLGWTFAMLAVLCLVCWPQEARKVTARSAPTYPELARKMHLTGKVKVEATVSAGGAVSSAKLIGGSPVFEKSALESVKQWRFESNQKETKEIIVLEFEDR